MPRKRQETRSGAPAQVIGSVPGQRYGEGVEQQAMQQAMPAPDRRMGGVGGGPPESMPGGGRPAMVDASVVAAPEEIQAYLAQNNPNLLSGTQRPDEPVTSGMSLGPGAGPGVLGMRNATTPLARYYENLSAETGNPKWKRLAEEAGL